MDRYDIDSLYSKSGSIGNFFARKVSNRHDREDLVQEVLFLAVKKIGSLKKHNAVDSWIYGICKNVLKQYYSRKSRDISGEIFDITYKDRFDEKIAINLLVNGLPERLKTVYELYFVKRLKINEIGRMLKLKEGTIKYQLYDLRQKIKEMIQEN